MHLFTNDELWVVAATGSSWPIAAAVRIIAIVIVAGSRHVHARRSAEPSPGSVACPVPPSFPASHRSPDRPPNCPYPGGIPEATVARLPVYLAAPYMLAERGVSTVASDELARAAGVNSAKLRKVLSHLGSYGIRGVGYDVEYLVYQVSRALGLTQNWPVVIVGAGNLGRALAHYGGFVTEGIPDRGGLRYRPVADRQRHRRGCGPAPSQSRRS